MDCIISWVKSLECVCCLRKKRHEDEKYYIDQEESVPIKPIKPKHESISKKIKKRHAPTRGDSVWGNLGKAIPEVSDDNDTAWDDWAKDDFKKGYSSYGLYGP